MISFNVTSMSVPVAGGNPWGSVMPDALADASAPDDVFHLSQTSPPSATTSSAPAVAPSPVFSADALSPVGFDMALAGAPGTVPGLKLLLLGAATSAKEEMARSLAEQHHLPHLHMGDLIKQEVASGSALGQALSEAKAQGQDSPAELIDKLMQKRVANSVDPRGFILDAYPSDLAQTDLKSLLGGKGQVRIIELTSKQSCPTCIPAIQTADDEGRYYQVEDDGDQESTGAVVEALVENFMTPNLGWLKK